MPVDPINNNKKSWILFSEIVFFFFFINIYIISDFFIWIKKICETVTSLKHNYLALILAIEEMISSTSATDVCAKVRGLYCKKKF